MTHISLTGFSRGNSRWRADFASLSWDGGAWRRGEMANSLAASWVRLKNATKAFLDRLPDRAFLQPRPHSGISG